MSNSWTKCDQDGCSGSRTGDETKCLAHVGPKERGTTLERFSRGGGLDVRGVTISEALFEKILTAAPRDAHGDRTFVNTRFERTIFESDAVFSGATFEGEWPLIGSYTVKSGAMFNGATFKHGVQFSNAILKGEARFDGTVFEGEARFDGTVFEGEARFGGVTFKSFALFSKAIFKGPAWFVDAIFKDNIGFDGTTFKGDALFMKAIFEGEVVPELGPIAVKGALLLVGAQFALPIRIEADAGTVDARRGRFAGGIRLDVQRALVFLDDADLSVPSLLTGPVTAAEGGSESTEPPKLVSLRRANAAGLTLGNVDLAACLFAGAYNLDKLRLEAGTIFGLSPAIAAWERRQIIAEEAAWRATRTRNARWSALLRPIYRDQPELLSPGAIASLYRALRKGREDAKDQPGAADFYYGEMEMRRHDRGDTPGGPSRGWVSRLVLTVYWLVSGYGLRAWRSLTALAVVMAVSAAVFCLWGFTSPTSYWKSLLFAFRSTLSLSDTQVDLTAWGGLFQAILRLTGPVLLALTLLALRERVKR